MQEEKYAELEDRAAFSSQLDAIKKLEARVRVQQEIELMKTEGKALELSEEEIQLLQSFRRFKTRMTKQGEVFTWQTRMPEGVQIVEDTALVVHPREQG